MTELGLKDLVANRTMSPEMAALLAETGRQGRSFIVTAIPRLAGKTTVMNAILGERPDDMPARVTDGSTLQLRAFGRAPERGYLVIPEISDAPVPGYLWGSSVRRVFAALDNGFALATALHSDGVEQTFDILCNQNAVPDEDAERIALVVYIRSLGTDWRSPTRRVVASVDEILSVRGGRPRVLRRYEWDEATDTFA